MSKPLLTPEELRQAHGSIHRSLEKYFSNEETVRAFDLAIAELRRKLAEAEAQKARLEIGSLRRILAAYKANSTRRRRKRLAIK